MLLPALGSLDLESDGIIPSKALHIIFYDMIHGDHVVGQSSGEASFQKRNVPLIVAVRVGPPRVVTLHGNVITT